MAKRIVYGMLHCAASPEGLDMKARQVADYHMRPVSKGGRGWDRPGYAEVVELDGTTVELRSYNDNDLVENHEMTWGATGLNQVSIHICYIGGVDKKGKPKDTRTPAQKKALEMIVKGLIKRWPWIKICGHYHFAAKACPSHDVEKWCEEIGLDEKNIYRNRKDSGKVKK